MVTLVTKLDLRPDIMVLSFDKKSFFNTILGFSLHWDYKNFTGHDDNIYYIEKKQKFE